MNREPRNINNDDTQYEAPEACQRKYSKDNDTHKDSLSFPIRSTAATQHEDGDHGCAELSKRLKTVTTVGDTT